MTNELKQALITRPEDALPAPVAGAIKALLEKRDIKPLEALLAGIKSEPKKQLIFDDVIRTIYLDCSSLKRGQFFVIVSEITKLDDSGRRVKLRVINAFEHLPEPAMLNLAQRMSDTKLTECLELLDIDFCDPDRMAAYIRHYAGKIYGCINNERFASYGYYEDHLDFVLGKCAERDDDSNEELFIHKVFCKLVNLEKLRRSYSLPVELGVIRVLAEQGCDSAGHFIELLGEDYEELIIEKLKLPHVLAHFRYPEPKYQ
ncbi:hypothetical protein HY045_03470 [Candidatus Woesebacteria bacterium]|nr:hypothetical protein [Candidatus Woesebacteria bacterium]